MTFYVYELIDPRDASVFYVGKGKRHRYRQHEIEARKGVHSRKCDRIRAILDDGHKVSHRIVERFKDEAEAYAFEVSHIAAIGLDKLTNVLPGGWGGYGAEPKPHKWTPAVVRKHANVIIRALQATQTGWWVYGHDCTEALRVFVRGIAEDIGVDELKKILFPKQTVRS